MCALEFYLRVFLAEQFHASLRVEIARFIFGASVDFMIAVTAPSAERSVQVADFFDAIGDGVARARNEIAGDDGEIGAEIVGHIDGTAHVGARHVSAKVDVANLDNLHAVESSGQIGQRNFDAAHLVIESLGGKAVHGGKKRSSAGGGGGSAEKIASACVSHHFRSASAGKFGTRLGGRLLCR